MRRGPRRPPPTGLSQPTASTGAPLGSQVVSQANERDFSPLPQDGELSQALDDAFVRDPEEALQESQVEGLIDLTDLEHRSNHGEEGGPSVDELKQAAEYAERDPAIDELEPVVFDEEEGLQLPIGAECESIIEHQIHAQEEALQMASLSLEPSHINMLDPPTDRSIDKHLQIPPFHMAMGLLAHFNGMPRTDYAAFRDAVNLLRGADGNPIPEVESLPTQLVTLKNRVMRRLPLLDMKEAQVPLRVDQLATETAARKRELQAAQQANPDSDLVADTLQADQVMSTTRFFDPESLFKAFLASSIGRELHIGLGYFVDHAQELWHAPCWTSAIRTTSGHYAHIIYTDDNGEVKPSRPIFPGDFVYYFCEGTEEQCWCEQLDTAEYKKAHLGRVSGVGKWYRNDPDHPTLERGDVVLEIQELYGWEDLLSQPIAGANRDGTAGSATAWRKQAEETIKPIRNERVLVDVFVAYIPQENVAGFANVFLD
ncbi:hypothetical protein NW759_015999 [Fusarium solani]|nr:hypothetical protein NW759_015999 [Fusarium solani]